MDIETKARESGWTQEVGRIFRTRGDELLEASSWQEALDLDRLASPMSLSSYAQVTEGPQALVTFFDALHERIAASRRPGERLDVFLARDVKVGGQPFSMGAHLARLEIASDAWDLQEVDSATGVRLVAAVRQMISVEPSYDAGKFILGFDAMINVLREAGVAMEETMPASRKTAPHGEHVVQSVLSAGDLSM